MNEPKMKLSTDSTERKRIPIATGVLDYFPLAISEVAKCSLQGNEQHHKGSPLHWDKTKSTDHADCIARHLVDRQSKDTDGVLHATKLAWRALALLETLLEEQQNTAAVEPSEEGWINYNGEGCPVGRKDRVLLVLRDGEATTSTPQEAGVFDWKQTGAGEDIVAYKVVKPEETPADKPVDDGWITWTGGNCPVPNETPVSVRLRDDNEKCTLDGIADDFGWANRSCGSDIVAYKIKENQ